MGVKDERLAQVIRQIRPSGAPDGVILEAALATVSDIENLGHSGNVCADPVKMAIFATSRELLQLSIRELVPPFELSSAEGRADTAVYLMPFHGWEEQLHLVLRSVGSPNLLVSESVAVLVTDGLVAVSQRDAARLALWVPPDAELACREVVHRQVLQQLLLAAGFFLLHGSGCCINDRAIVAVGPSGSGKSTLQLELCRTMGADVLGGGRVYVNRKQEVLPYPGRFSVDSDYLERIPLGAQKRRPKKIGIGRKASVPSRVLASRLGVSIASRGTLAAILFPVIHDGPFSLRRIPQHEALLSLSSEVLEPDPAIYCWTGLSRPRGPDSIAEFVGCLAASIPCFRVLMPRGRPHLLAAEAESLIEMSMHLDRSP